MANILANFSFIDKACQQLIQPKKCSYNIHQLYRSVKQFPNLSIENIKIQESSENSIACFFVKNTPQKKELFQCSRPCIIYSHGLSSYSMEGRFLIPHLKGDFSLCLYDSRGHGKSTTNNITYGKQESQDIYNIIVDLKSKSLASQFILWGRSMGSVSSLLMMLNNHNDDKIKGSIRQLVLDSPFSSFQTVSCDILMQNMSIPKIIAQIVIATFVKKLDQNFKIDTRKIDITNCKDVKVPAIFLYSEIDTVIKPYHTNQIYQNYGGNKEKIKFSIQHNENRPQYIILQVFKRLRSSLLPESLQQIPINSKRGIMLMKNTNFLHRSPTKQTEQSIYHKLQRREFKLNSNKYIRPGIMSTNNNQLSQMNLSHRLKQNNQTETPLKKLGSRKKIVTNRKLTNHFYI